VSPPMNRVGVSLRCLPLALLGACTCGTKGTTATTDAARAQPNGSSSTPGVPAPLPSATPADFSAPLGAVRTPSGDFVAGLVAAAGIVRVQGAPAGAPSWSSDALRGVAWVPDAELRMQPAADGVALMWRGQRDGKNGRTLLVLGPRGEARGNPLEIGAAFCTTLDGIAWIDAHATGPTRVRARRWSETSPREMVSVSPDRDPSLVCGDHDVFVLGDGDDDLTATAFVPGDASPQPPTAAIRDSDFGDDDEREHDAYSIGDDLGLVRIGSSGALAIREVPRGGTPTAWRKLKHAVSGDDDVVAVDGDATAILVVFTHDAADTCPGVGSTAEGVKALRIDRKSGDEALYDLAAPDCDRSRGPFWIAAAPGSPVVAWVERGATLAPGAPPIAGVGFRVMRPDATAAGRVDLKADVVADAGCNASGCAVAALLRPPDTDGKQPGPIRVFGYP